VRPLRRGPPVRGGLPHRGHHRPTAAITYVDADQTGYGRMRAWAAKTDAAATTA